MSSSLHNNHSSLAQVLSPWIHLRDINVCLSLWYQMDSRSAEKFTNHPSHTLHYVTMQGCPLSCIPCLVSSLTSSVSVHKCHLDLNHLPHFVQDLEYSVAEFTFYTDLLFGKDLFKQKDNNSNLSST